MGFISKLKEIFSSSGRGDSNLINIKVVCKKCGEEIDSYFRKNYDIQTTYGNEDYTYLINKQLVCSKCYQSISLRIEFDNNFNDLNQEIMGGEIVDESKPK